LKYQSLEAFRGLAAVLVALFHSAFVAQEQYPIIAQGAIFVDFFFILSGFVITFAYAEKIANGFGFIPFFILRFGRLYPLHLFLLLIWLPYITAKAIIFYKFGIGDTDPLEHNNALSFASNLFLINALNIHDYLSWNFPAWSISVELFTYIIFFFSFSLIGRFNPLLVAATISIAAYSSLYFYNHDTLLKTYDWGLIRCMGGFFLGSVIFYLPKKFISQVPPIFTSILEIVVTALMILLVLKSANSPTYQLASFISFGVVIYIFSIQETGVISKLLTVKPILFLGTLSYSIYMTHALIFAVFATVGKKLFDLPVKLVGSGQEQATLLITPYADIVNLALLGLIVGISYLTYRFVEVPWRDKFRTLAIKQPTKSELRTNEQH